MKIQVVNQSSVIDEAVLEKMVNAVNVQVSRDFARYWGITGQLTVVPSETAGFDATMLVCDNSDQAGALGYHELDSHGKPLGNVFAKTDLQYRMNSCVTLSHETLELLADPLGVFSAQDDQSGDFYCLEVCDAVEDDSLGYTIDGQLVSDFVLPAWFARSEKAPYDFLNHCTAPFQVLAGGYTGFLDITNPKAGWQTRQDKSLRCEAYGVRTRMRLRGIQ